MTPPRHQTHLTIQRPAHLGGGTWQLTGLERVSVLFGKNGSGKSLMLRAWRDQDREACHYVVPERSGDIGFNINLVQQEAGGRERSGHSQGNWLTDYRSRALSRIQSFYNARGAGREATLASPTPQELEDLLNTLLPDFRIELRDDSTPYAIFRTEDGTQVGNVSQLSSGEAQLLALGVDIVTVAAIWEVRRTPGRILLLDEPDAHIHPDLQARFADFLVRVADRFELQLVIATHSTSLLAAIAHFAAQDAAVIYLDRRHTVFAAKRITNVHRETATILGGHALMGPLFGVPLLLVEGDDDYRVWSQVPRHHQASFAVIPCNGDEIKKYQAALEATFAALRDTATGPSGYALLDGDKPLPQPGSPPQTHISFLRLNCHELENLYLTQEVLASMNLDWPTAIERVVGSSAISSEHGAQLAAIGSWDRRMIDLKPIMRELVGVLDPNELHWTDRVGKAIGRSRPAGELADFLGNDVVRALWQ